MKNTNITFNGIDTLLFIAFFVYFQNIQLYNVAVYNTMQLYKIDK